MNRTIAATLVLLAGTAGCIKMKHEMVIQPVHVTVEVRVKIDQALNDFFADIDQSKPGQPRQEEAK